MSQNRRPILVPGSLVSRCPRDSIKQRAKHEKWFVVLECPEFQDDDDIIVEVFDLEKNRTRYTSISFGAGWNYDFLE